MTPSSPSYMKWIVTFASLVAGCRAPAVEAPSRRKASVEELVRIRCSLDGAQVLTTWSGAVYAVVPGEPIQHVFDIEGMNVARCLEHDGAWHLTSRELMYYLAPDSDRVLGRWTNPWTLEEVPVVHVANRLVQSRLGGGVPLEISRGRATIVLDVPLHYPNVLARDPATRPFSPDEMYQAIEMFALSAPVASSLTTGRATASELELSWHRVGPWLPWMNMGDRAGRLLYRAHGRKLRATSELSPLLRQEIEERVPLYRDAPRCVVNGRRNETSWTYFAASLASYLEGARFPLPAAPDPTECP